MAAMAASMEDDFISDNLDAFSLHFVQYFFIFFISLTVSDYPVILYLFPPWQEDAHTIAQHLCITEYRLFLVSCISISAAQDFRSVLVKVMWGVLR